MDINKRLDELQSELDSIRQELEQPQTYWDWYWENASELNIDYYFRPFQQNGNAQAFDIDNEMYWDEVKPHVLRFWAERIMEWEIARANGDWKPDWSDSSQPKACFYYNSNWDWQSIICYFNQHVPDSLYFELSKGYELKAILTDYPFPDGNRRNVFNMWIGRKQSDI